MAGRFVDCHVKGTEMELAKVEKSTVDVFSFDKIVDKVVG